MEKVKTKEKILITALDIISNEGIDQLSVTNIANKLCITKSLVLYHFSSNNMIVSALFERMSEMGRIYTSKALNNKETPEDQLIAIASGAFSWIVKHKEYGEFFALMYHLSSKSEELFKVHLKTLNMGLERIEYILLKSGDICTSKEAHLLALSLHNLIIGFCLRAISTNFDNSLDDNREALRMSMEKIIGRKLSIIEIID